jgi:hypothetical protein
MIQKIGKILLTGLGCWDRNEDVKPNVKNLITRNLNLPDMARELLDGNVRTASLGPHTSLAMSGCFF